MKLIAYIALATGIRNREPDSGGQDPTEPGGDLIQCQASYFTEWRYNYGSCGFPYNNPKTVALSAIYMEQGKDLYCGRYIRVYRSKNGKVKQVDLMVADTCPGCVPTNGRNVLIDLTDVAFGDLLFDGESAEQLGLIDVEWEFIS